MERGYKMFVSQIINLAEWHSCNLEVDHLAVVWLDEATWYYDNSNLGAAKTYALMSLKHSIGVFHPDYRKAVER